MTSDSVPPPYAESGDGAQPTKKFESLRLPAGIKPSNFLRINRPKDLWGVWVIDPSMGIPKDSFPGSSKLSTSLNSDKDRKNLELATTTAGSDIFADVFIQPTSNSKTSMGHDSKRTLVSLESSGKLTLRLHDASPEVKTEDRLPIVVSATSKGGSMRAHLPKSFCGPLHLQAVKRVWYSPAVKAQITPLSEVEGNHAAFIGNFDAKCWDGWDSWKGDSFSGDAGQNAIDIYFDDEDYIPTKDSNCTCM